MRYNKPVVISEFGSASSGGNKARWIAEAMQEIKQMPEVKAFILFNMDKEADWKLPFDDPSGIELRFQMQDSYFVEE